jgi:hypothetical protein
MDEWPQWAGDIPTWITTAAIALAALQLFAERKKRAAEEVRESKSQASELTSWTVSDGGTKNFGLVVSNTSRSTFHNVEITVQLHDQLIKTPVRLTVLPPGTFYIRYSGDDPRGRDNSRPFAWEFPIDANSYDGWLRPYMNSPKYQVLKMAFKDNLKQAWHTDAQALLTKV